MPTALSKPTCFISKIVTVTYLIVRFFTLWLAGKQMRRTEGQTDRQTGRQADRQTGRQTDRQADRQTDRLTD